MIQTDLAPHEKANVTYVPGPAAAENQSPQFVPASSLPPQGEGLDGVQTGWVRHHGVS